MEKEDLNDEGGNNLDILRDIFDMLQLANMYYTKLCKNLNIRQVEFHVLYWLYISEDKCISMSELGYKLDMARSGVTVLIDRMIVAGLVARSNSISDRRIIKIMITDKGNETIQKIFPNKDNLSMFIADFIDQEEKIILCKLLEKTKEKFINQMSVL